MREEFTRKRLARMLEEDKESINAETERAVRRELCRVAGEYFETEGDVSFSVEKEKAGYGVKISFHATRIKNFTALK